ncbi:MAG TPA: sulfotransferase [Rhizomicrobium sp.]
MLRGLGRLEECVAACGQVLALDPDSGGAWWNLADLKAFRFADEEIAQMERTIAKPDISPDDRACLHFALGKAYADRSHYEKSFGNYARGNALRRLAVEHDPDVLTADVARARQVFTPDLFGKFAGSGSESHEPIFVVGMMRSGSTVIEQILASHPQIEGTRELAEIAAVSQSRHSGLRWRRSCCRNPAGEGESG